MTAKEAIELCDEILDMIEDDIDEKAYDRGFDFFSSVQEKVKSMKIWIEENDKVTPKMVRSLEGMRDGVAKWIKD